MDKLDIAKDLEMEHRQRSLKAQRDGRVKEKPDEVDGIRYCLDCGDPVPKKRLDAEPDAVRCVECQQYHE